LFDDNGKMIGYEWLADHPEAKWPNFYDTNNAEAFKGHVITQDGEEQANATPDIADIKVVYTK
jgi:hypothetical protein